MHHESERGSAVANGWQYTYAASILFIVSMFFAKLSVILFLMAITPSKPIHRCCHVLSAIIAGWTVCGVFALAFQCQLPSPWMTDDNQCIDRYGLQLFLGIVNIVTDLGLIVIPTIVMKNVQTNTRRKWQVVALFATRILYGILIETGESLADVFIFQRSSLYDPSAGGLSEVLRLQR